MAPGQKAVVQYAELNRYDRVIVISDLHGDCCGFYGVLNKVGFTQKDALVIVGDILEKGEHSLELLKAVMNCSRAGNLYMVAGNNDVIFSEWYSGEVSDEDVHWYLHSRRSSVIMEMAGQLHMPYDTLEDVKALKAEIRERFAEEIRFLDRLPHILDSGLATFVHAGIKPGSLEEQDRDYCLTAPSFGKQTVPFEKMVIVGHWPASNYSGAVINVNAYFNSATKVISIDGGNSMKGWGQINYLILKDGGIQAGYYDDLPQIKALDAQKETREPLSLIFPDTLLEVVEEGETASKCYFPSLNREMEIANEAIYPYKGKKYSRDFTTYGLPVEEGEILSYCETAQDGILVKRGGIVGKYSGRYVFVNDGSFCGFSGKSH